MSVDDVVDMLGRIVSGEYTTDQISQIRAFLLSGIDFSAFMA